MFFLYILLKCIKVKSAFAFGFSEADILHVQPILVSDVIIIQTLMSL